MYTYRIEIDTDPLNPRNEFDNLSTFYAVKNSHYITGGKNDIEFSYREDLEEEIKELRKAGAVVVEFYNPHVGDCYAVVDLYTLAKEYKGYTQRKAKYHARSCAKGEIETWLAYVEGEVYGYIVENEDGEHVDSCWGFYGEEYARQEAESSVQWHEKQEKQAEQFVNTQFAL